MWGGIDTSSHIFTTMTFLIAYLVFTAILLGLLVIDFFNERKTDEYK